MKSYIEQLKSDIEDKEKNLEKAKKELCYAEKFSEGLKKIKKLEMKPLLNGHENIVLKCCAVVWIIINTYYGHKYLFLLF